MAEEVPSGKNSGGKRKDPIDIDDETYFVGNDGMKKVTTVELGIISGASFI